MTTSHNKLYRFGKGEKSKRKTQMFLFCFLKYTKKEKTYNATTKTEDCCDNYNNNCYNDNNTHKWATMIIQ